MLDAMAAPASPTVVPSSPSSGRRSVSSAPTRCSMATHVNERHVESKAATHANERCQEAAPKKEEDSSSYEWEEEPEEEDEEESKDKEEEEAAAPASAQTAHATPAKGRMDSSPKQEKLPVCKPHSRPPRHAKEESKAATHASERCQATAIKNEEKSFEREEEPEEDDHEENEDEEEEEDAAPASSQTAHATLAKGRIQSSRPVRKPPSPPPPPPGGARRRERVLPQASGAPVTVCNICGHRLKGGAAALSEHQKHSSKCRYRQGLLPGHTRGGRSLCPHGCGRTVATQDDWALQQHEWFCTALLQRQDAGSSHSYRRQNPSRRCGDERKRDHRKRSRSRR